MIQMLNEKDTTNQQLDVQRQAEVSAGDNRRLYHSNAALPPGGNRAQGGEGVVARLYVWVAIYSVAEKKIATAFGGMRIIAAARLGKPEGRHA